MDISKRTRIHRSNIYDTLRELTKEGFVLEIVDNGRKVFEALPPERIEDYIKQKENEFQAILPHLKNFSTTEEDPGRMSVSEGVFALREAALKLLDLNAPIRTYGASTETVEAFGEPFLKEFHKERIKRKISQKHIYNSDSKKRVEKLSKLGYTEARTLPVKYDTNVCTTICGDRVLLFIFGKPIIVLTIINQRLAEAYENYFELLWKSAR